jgi:xylulokinase
MSALADVVIGVDAGTTSVKAVAIDASGTIVSMAASDAIPTATPSPGASVQSPAAIWDAFCDACRQLSASLPPSTRVQALAVAAQSGSVIPIVGPDAGEAAGEAITWMDTRSLPVVESWGAQTVETIRARSGWMPSPGLGLSTISWLRSTPRIRADRWASVDDYLMWKLTGSWLTNPSNAAGMQLMDVASMHWSPDLCSIAGIDASTLSTIRNSGDVAGVLHPSAGRVTDLPDSLPVVIGGHDQACAALGLDVTAPGSALLSMGTAWVLTMITDRAEITSIPAGFNLSPHVLTHRWSLSQNLGGLGAVIASELADLSGDPSFAIEFRGPSLDDPYFLPAIHQPDRTSWGVFTKPAADPESATRVRAVMEACAFEVRKAVEAAAPGTGLTELTLVGGGTRSEYLTQYIADTIGVPLTVRADASWPALGAARLAAGSRRWSPDIAAGMPSTTVQPHQSLDDTNDRRYAEYNRLMTGPRQ